MTTPKSKTYDWNKLPKAAFTSSLMGKKVRPVTGFRYLPKGGYMNTLIVKNGLIKYEFSGPVNEQQVTELREKMADDETFTVTNLSGYLKVVGPAVNILAPTKDLDINRRLNFYFTTPATDAQQVHLDAYLAREADEKAAAKAKKVADKKRLDAIERRNATLSDTPQDVLDVASALLVLRRAGLKVVTVEEKK